MSPDAGDGSQDRDDDGDDNGDDNGDDDQPGGRRRRRRGGRRRRRGGGGGGEDGDGSNADSDGDSDTSPAAKSDDKQSDGSGGNKSGGNKSGGNKSGGGGKSGAKSGGNAGQGGGKGQQGGGKSQQDGGGKDDGGPDGDGGNTRRRRRRRRAGEEGDGGPDDPENTVTRVRKPRSAEDEITSLQGSTRLEAKKQRRREGREAGRRRAPIVSEAEFLARREAVDRVMVIRQQPNLTQIAVLEDKVLVEHYVARESQSSLIGNVYLGRVQNVLPSMEAAFIDIGKGRNAVLYAGEVNWDSLGAGNGPRKIEQVLKSGQPILVQVTKDPIGHKGARLTSQVSLPGRFLVYVPDGNTSGISRKLPDTERTRLKNVLKEIVPDTAGVIVRTAAEGASEDELTRDVERLTARWSDIEAKVEKSNDKGGGSPQLLYGEPDLTLKVVRDLFTEDFGKLVVSGDDAWEMVEDYVKQVAPDLEERLERYDENDAGDDVFAAYRIDEQIAKGLDRKVWLPSGGSLDLRPHGGDDGRRREHREVHRLRRQPRGDRHQEQPGGCRGDGPAATAARHRRDHRRRLHRHGAGEQPRPGAPPPRRVPGSRPHPPPGRRGDVARAGADDPQAHRHRAPRGVQRDLRALSGTRTARAPRAGRAEAQAGRRASPWSARPAWRQLRRLGRGRPATATRPRARPRPRTLPPWPGTSRSPPATR